MGAIASQITSLTIVYSTVYSDADTKKTSKLRVTGLCAGNSLGTGEFPAQMASNAENVSIWWRHHAVQCQWSYPEGYGWTDHMNTQGTANIAKKKIKLMEWNHVHATLWDVLYAVPACGEIFCIKKLLVNLVIIVTLFIRKNFSFRGNIPLSSNLK